MKKILTFMLFVACLFSCKKDDPEAKFVEDPADKAGNLLIINNSGQRLVLYKGEVAERKISSASSDYLVKLANPSEAAVEMSLYLYDDVKGDMNNPPLDKVFKKWKVPLSKGTEVSRQVTWHVGATNDNSNSGTLKLKYYAYAGLEGYNVDVHLNGKTGAKIASLKPGDQDRQIGLDYGSYTLSYHYWSSDQNTADGVKDNGWMNSQTIDGEDVSFWVVLNAGRSESTTVINHMGTDAGQVLYGKIKVNNNKNYPVQIWINGKLIEEVCYLVDGNTDNLSVINMQDTYTYILPITTKDATTEEYTLKVSRLSNEEVQEATKITITADKTLIWEVE